MQQQNGSGSGNQSNSTQEQQSSKDQKNEQNNNNNNNNKHNDENTNNNNDQIQQQQQQQQIDYNKIDTKARYIDSVIAPATKRLDVKDIFPDGINGVPDHKGLKEHLKREGRLTDGCALMVIKKLVWGFWE